jgi:hypothetical protein
MKKYLLIVAFLITLKSLYANSAQPGIYGAGGIPGNYSLLYPEDSLGFKKIQMQKERISIQLYNGFAVVKGEYWMLNNTPDEINIKTGYPVNSIEDRSGGMVTDYSHYRRHVQVDDLYGVKVYVDSLQITNLESVGTYKTPTWYVWKTKFRPNGITKITVYFIVNTNDASIRPSGDTEPNGFIYLLETGSTWKDSISNGEINVQLMDDVNFNDIVGSEPESIFSYNKENKILRYTFKDLYPNYQNNIVLTYGNHLDNFKINEIVKTKESYYKEVDLLSDREMNNILFEPNKFNSPFKLKHTKNWITGILCTGIPILIVFLIAYRFFKRSK